MSFVTIVMDMVIGVMNKGEMYLSYNRFLNLSFSVNVKCYHCQKLGHIAKHSKLRITKKKKEVSNFGIKNKIRSNLDSRKEGRDKTSLDRKREGQK